MLAMLFIFMGLTALVLVAGLSVMVAGGSINERLSNKLMTARVVMQAAALLILALLFLMG